ncbi:nucleotidyltransferase [Methanobacterium formicicum]|uniref:protein adenylyltransferase n=1 Tax=Methanobacterium formicicum (strain DSM 3637 / PP1) TaxID=1204725 RepID=K2R5T0_METFP|nr:nucleotidyltransferase [Methanobacterium formicicum]EKF86597.1 hypothetical protein A994_03913 [Methanobacterium formicicum DSM 3637]
MVGIPEAKLESWASKGAIVTAETTHKSVRKALDACDELRGIDPEIYLQGSYKNSTNIRGESDVDVVIQLNKTYTPYTLELSTKEQELYKSAHIDATYFLPEFKNAVLDALKAYFGYSMVSEGNKCIKIKKDSNRLDADVIVCNQYRKYKRYVNWNDQDFYEGIIFYTKLGDKIISYPKIHYDNGVNKNSVSKTNNLYKPTVRLFKNARSYMVNQGIIKENIAPSFFVECLLYNVPDTLFQNQYSTTYLNIIKWIVDSLSNGDYKNFVCQDEQTKLFGDTHKQWNLKNGVLFLSELIDLWQEW